MRVRLVVSRVVRVSEGEGEDEGAGGVRVAAEVG